MHTSDTPASGHNIFKFKLLKNDKEDAVMKARHQGETKRDRSLKRLATHIVASLPDDPVEAHKVLNYAREIVDYIAAGVGPIEPPGAS